MKGASEGVFLDGPVVWGGLLGAEGLLLEGLVGGGSVVGGA